jgi:hypothetical protein
MMKLFLILCTILAAAPALSAQPVYTLSEGVISFFSESPLEDISAENKSIRSILNTSSHEIAFIVPVRQFHFKKALMEEHFNEKYLESDVYPMATFKGTLSGMNDITRDTVWPATASGTLRIHGIDRPVTCTGTVEMKKGTITVRSTFRVALEDYRVPLPKLLTQNIADTIDVRIVSVYTPYQK